MMKYRPLSVGDPINDSTAGASWTVPVWIDDSPNCMFAEALHESREMARQRAVDIARAVNGYFDLAELVEELADLCPRMSDDDPAAPAIADTIKRARGVIGRP